MNLPSRAQMVGMAERLQSIEGQLNEIKAMLHQVHHNSLAPDGGLRRAAAAAHQASAIGGRAKMNAPAGLDLASIPERIQSEVQRAIQRSIKGVEYIASSGPVARLDAEGHSGRPRHHEPLSLSADRG